MAAPAFRLVVEEAQPAVAEMRQQVQILQAVLLRLILFLLQVFPLEAVVGQVFPLAAVVGQAFLLAAAVEPVFLLAAAVEPVSPLVVEVEVVSLLAAAAEMHPPFASLFLQRPVYLRPVLRRWRQYLRPFLPQQLHLLGMHHRSQHY